MGTCTEHHLHFNLHLHLWHRYRVAGVGGKPLARVDTQIRSSLRGGAVQPGCSWPRGPRGWSQDTDARSRAPARRRGRRAESSAASAFPRGLRGSGCRRDREPLNGGSLALFLRADDRGSLVQQVHRALYLGHGTAPPSALRSRCRENRGLGTQFWTVSPDSVDTHPLHLMGMKCVP